MKIQRIDDVIGDFLQGSYPVPPLGVILFGSWARGNAEADSDIDLLVFVAEGFRRFAKKWQNQYFEVTETTPGSAIKFWRDHRDDCADLWSHARVLVEQDGTIASLKAIATGIIADGPAQLSAAERNHSLFDLRDSLRAIRSIAQRDPALAELLLGKTILSATELFFRIRTKWLPPPKQRLEAIRALNSEVGARVDRALNAGISLAIRCHELAEAIRLIETATIE